MFCVIWYHLHNLKNVKNTHEGVLLLAKLQVLACNFNKSNTPPWVFFPFFKLSKRYQITQRGTIILSYYSALSLYNFFKENFYLSRHLHFCVFGEFTNFQIYDVITDNNGHLELRFQLFL